VAKPCQTICKGIMKFAKTGVVRLGGLIPEAIQPLETLEW
jgi:nitrogenase subunit NifH